MISAFVLFLVWIDVLSLLELISWCLDRELDEEMQDTLLEYLEERGVNDELAGFLHGYMANKDRTELVRWLRNIETYVKK